MKEIRACFVSTLLLSTGLAFAQQSKFQVIQGDFTWQEAKEDAEARGGHLATVTSSQEMSELAQFLTNYSNENGRPSPWIGGFEAGSPLEWRWVTGETFSYENWYIGLTTVNPPGDDEIYLVHGSGGWEFYPINRNGSRLPNYILELPQLPVSSATLWSLGADDNTIDWGDDLILDDPATLNGAIFNVSGALETGQQDLPGSSESGRLTSDDDYYFAGVYTSASGNYTPIGIVETSEQFYDRAIGSHDPNMRWHFNMPEVSDSYDRFRFTIDFYDLSEANTSDTSSFDLTFWVNGTQIGETQSHLDSDLASAQNWEFDIDDLGGIEQLGPGFDHYVEVKSSPNGSARWATLDYVKLEGIKTGNVEPLAPVLNLQPLYESHETEAVVVDATPTDGYPTTFTYQWCLNGFKIPPNLGGTASSFEISSLVQNQGTWSVTVTNSEGSIEQVFEYRLYADSDSDGLSDGYEEVISLTDKNKPDTDNDGLSDSAEVNIYATNPNSPDSDADGFTDLYEIETAYNPNSAESVPSALVNIMTAIEVNFNAALGATYAIEFSTDSQNWTVIEDNIIGEGSAVERLYSRKDYPVGFFRVERRDQ